MSDPRVSRRARQKGSVLIAVTVVGLAGALLLAAFMNHSVLVEERAIDARLAETRAYWAIMGHFRYGLSRTARSYMCNKNCSYLDGQNFKDSEKVAVLQTYLNEISSYRTISYPEEPSGYFLKIATTASEDDRLHQNYSGYIMMKGTYPTSGQSTFSYLQGATARMGGYELRFCAGVVFSGWSCGNIGNNNGGWPTPYYSISRLTRLVPGS